jgi:maleylacetate reductase
MKVGGMEFIHDTRTPRVIFADNALSHLKDEVTKIGGSKVVLVCDESARSVAKTIAEELNNLVRQKVDHVVMHVPDDFTEPIIALAKNLGIDIVIAVGGGSATGLGKILALECRIPLLAIPTTYAGSEMTPIWGRTKNKVKLTGTDHSVLPKVVLYQPSLTYTLPKSISVNSGMNAIAHAVESLYSPQLSPIVELAALEGISVMASGLRKLAKNFEDHSAREELFYGSMLCGFTLGNAKMGIHHKICHTLGGMFNLPHAPMHSAVLPYAVKYNEKIAEKQLAKVAQILGASTASQGLWNLSTEIGAEYALKNPEFSEAEIENVTEAISGQVFINPRPFEHDFVVKLLKAANNGTRPDDESW